jgi:hypothetical protein
MAFEWSASPCLVSLAALIALVACREKTPPIAQGQAQGGTGVADRWWESAASACERAGFGAKLHSRYISPGGRFEILLCRRPLLFAFPGGASDAPGKLYLVETRSGKTLASADIEMVWEMQKAIWSATFVDIGLARWALPVDDTSTGKASAVYYEGGVPRAEIEPP